MAQTDSKAHALIIGLFRASVFVVALALFGLAVLAFASDEAGAQDFDAGWQAYRSGDYAAAATIWQPLAESGDPRAQYNLGSLYYDGQGVAQDKTLAIKWWGDAAAQGVIEAQHNLGLVYLSGDGADKDIEKARFWIERAAIAGLGRSQYTLGKMYLHADEIEGAKPDEAKAFEWILKAGQSGDYRAQYNLGNMYRDGTGTAVDQEQSVAWFRRAAEQGYARAQNHLGVRYARGQGVAQDDIQALKWIWLAAEQGDKEAMRNRQSLFLRMNSDQIAEAKTLAQTEGPGYVPLVDDTQSHAAAAAEPAPESPPAPKPALQPAPAKAPAPPAPPQPQPVAPQPVAPQPAPVPPAAAPQPAPQTAGAPATGDSWVQLGSFRNPARSERWWEKVSSERADLLAGLSHEVQPVDLGAAKGVWYRLRVGPMAKAAAGQLCDRLKSVGYDCLVTR
jgi:TPR repeat protein